MRPLSNIENILSGAFGLWITGLFGSINGWNPDLTFAEHREAFFWLVKKLLDEGKVKFEPPKELWSTVEGNVWEESSDVIIDYLRSRWPEEAKHENDRCLNDYFYNIPPILWVGEDGKLYGS